MTNSEIAWRLKRVYAALGDVSGSLPEDEEPPVVLEFGARFHAVQDFSAGRSKEQLETDAYKVINEIMGIKDRARAWMKAQGKDPDKVEAFVKADRSAALIHDLANADKHGQHGRQTLSGLEPKLVDVSRGAVLKRDPNTGLYMSSGTISFGIDMKSADSKNLPSSNTEMVLTGNVVDRTGSLIEQLHDVFFHSIRNWEAFLTSEGVILT